MVRLGAVILLLAFSAHADDSRTFSQEEVNALVQKLQAFREREQQEFVNELRGLDQQNNELRRKSETLTGRYLCS